MNLCTLKTVAKAILPFFAGICLFPMFSPAAAYLKFGDIKGEATDNGHKDWIIIESIDSGGIEEEMASGLPTGKRQHKPLVVTKAVDKATPLLMNLLATGATTPEVILELEPENSTLTKPYFQMRMKKVLVSSVDLENGDPDQPVIVGLSLNFPYAEWHYQQTDPDGKVIDRVSAFFDAELNESGPISQAPQIGQIGNIDAVSGGVFSVDISVQDFDTDYLDLEVEVEADPEAVAIGPVIWLAPEGLRIAGAASPTYSGQTTITLRVSDGINTSSMSFSLFIDSTGSPWEGFMQAYFTAEERQDLLLSSPIADPDGDLVATLLEFLIGTNPREFTPPELQRQVTARHITPGGPDDDGLRIEIRFKRRNDEPLIRLILLGSPDGETWTPLVNGGDNPLYQETSKEGSNPLYDDVTGTVNPPGGGATYFVRFVAEMN